MMSYAASFYLERALHVEEILHFRLSEVAAAAVCLAISHPQIDDKDPDYDPGEMVSSDRSDCSKSPKVSCTANK